MTVTKEMKTLGFLINTRTFFAFFYATPYKSQIKLDSTCFVHFVVKKKKNRGLFKIANPCKNEIVLICGEKKLSP